MLGNIEGREKEVTEDKMAGWHHFLNGHKLEQTLRDSEGQGSLACCCPWCYKKSDTTELLNNNNILWTQTKIFHLHLTMKEFESICKSLFSYFIHMQLKALRHWIVSSFSFLIFPVKKQQAVFKSRRRQWHPTLVLLPGKSHGWRSLVGCSPWGC